MGISGTKLMEKNQIQQIYQQELLEPFRPGHRFKNPEVTNTSAVSLLWAMRH